MIWLVLHTCICIPLLWFKLVFFLRKNDSEQELCEQLCRKSKCLCGGISVRCVGLGNKEKRERMAWGGVGLLAYVNP